jgi:hypothetical protein
MTEARPFAPVKLICGVIAKAEAVFATAEKELVIEFGPMDFSSNTFPFDLTEYYAKQMGGAQQRKFHSFERLIQPDDLSEIKLRTNRMEEEVRDRFEAESRIINLDPGCLSGASLVMGTAKAFAHRIPLRGGIYGHLELLLGKDAIQILEWTYPDFKSPRYHPWLCKVRQRYLDQLRALNS